MLRRAVYRAFLRCASRVDRSLDHESHLWRNAADIVIRSSASIEDMEMLKDACRSCSEKGAKCAVREASCLLIKEESLDAAISWLPAAHTVANAADALSPKANFLADAKRSTEADRAEAAAFRMAAVIGASQEDIAAARQELDRRAIILSQQLAEREDMSLYDMLNALADTECLGNSTDSDPWPRAEDNAYRLDRYLLGHGPAAPIICVVAALAVAARVTAIQETALCAIGAPGRFLLGIRGTLCQTKDAKNVKKKENQWFAEFGRYGRELLSLSLKSDDTQLIATKLTGDSHVPAGEICFKVLSGYTLEAPIGSSFPVKLRVADVGFEHPRWLDAHLVLVSSDEMAIVHKTDTPGAPVIPTLFLRRAFPTDKDSVIFLDCLSQRGKIYTRTQLTNGVSNRGVKSIISNNQDPESKDKSRTSSFTPFAQKQPGKARVKVSEDAQLGVVAISVSLGDDDDDDDDDDDNDEDSIMSPSETSSETYFRTPPPLASADDSSSAPSLNTTKSNKRPSHPDLTSPFPEVDSIEVARRICRNLHNAALRREDALASMIATHAGLDFGEPSSS